MTLSDIISTKNSKSPGKSREILLPEIRLAKTPLKTHLNDMVMFCDIIGLLTSKYRPDFFDLRCVTFRDTRDMSV